jgi:hypothetical protein
MTEDSEVAFSIGKEMIMAKADDRHCLVYRRPNQPFGVIVFMPHVAGAPFPVAREYEPGDYDSRFQPTAVAETLDEMLCLLEDLPPYTVIAVPKRVLREFPFQLGIFFREDWEEEKRLRGL